MLLLFLGRRVLRASRPSFRLLSALLLVVYLSFIDVVAVDPARGRIKEEISLSAFYTNDGDMGLSLTVDVEFFCFFPPCPSQPDSSTSVFLGHAYFESHGQRTWFHNHVRIGEQERKQEGAQEGEQELESGKKNIAFQTWQHVNATMKLLDMFSMITQETMYLWLEKLRIAEKSTKIDQATWLSWRTQKDEVSFVKLYYSNGDRLSGKACLKIGTHPYCLGSELAGDSVSKPSPAVPIGNATFANVGTRDGFLHQVDKLVETLDKDTMRTWLDAMKKDVGIDMNLKTPAYFDHWAYIHKLMTLLRATPSGLDEPSTAITEETWQHWKQTVAKNVASLEAKKGLRRERDRQYRQKLRQNPDSRVIQRERLQSNQRSHAAAQRKFYWANRAKMLRGSKARREQAKLLKAPTQSKQEGSS
ncbi:hypothetical protein C8R42DRAFT_722998 [Lentinula raphanica]|nr:hypothetical protein C8R42DRAFT_722998 [Lentinula raphanica]